MALALDLACYGIAVRIVDNRVIAGTGLAHAEEPKLRQVQAIVDKRGPRGLFLSDPIWLAPFTINGRKVKDFRSGRVFLAGDTAHIHSPQAGRE